MGNLDQKSSLIQKIGKKVLEKPQKGKKLSEIIALDFPVGIRFPQGDPARPAKGQEERAEGRHGN